MIISIIAILFVLGIVILFHELGHFIVAKRSGIRVNEFGLGFPPKLFKFKRGETTYAINTIPFGGYVTMAGDDPDKLTGEKWEFLSAPISKRAMITFAGPLVNLVLGLIIFSVILMIGEPTADIPNIIGSIKKESIAYQTGLRPMDKVIKVGDVEVSDWEGMIMQMLKTPRSNDIKLTIERDMQQKELLISQSKMGKIDIIPYLLPEIGSVRPGSPAQKAGLKQGDIITFINDKSIDQWDQLTQIIHDNPEKALTVKIKRGKDTFTVAITPIKQKMLNEKEEVISVGIIGIGPKTKIKRLDCISAIVEGTTRTISIIFILLNNLWALLTGKLSLALFAGPIGIAKMISIEAHTGLINLFIFIAFISINLGVVNLIPIPILDGGHLFIYAIEGIRRKPLSPKVHQNIVRISIAFLIGVMLFVTYQDILRAMGIG